MTENELGDIIYGQNEWTKAQIDANPASVTQIDGYGGGGHGTHVTSIAAGNDTNGSYPEGSTGVAPESDIIFVKGDRSPNSDSGFSDDDIIDGVAYMMEKAAILGKPIVVNLSLGGNYGPLDGTSLYERFLTQLTGTGKIIVAAAGNEGFDYLHTGYQNSISTVVGSLDFPWDDISFDKFIWTDEDVISAYKLIALNPNTLQQVGATNWLPFGSSNWNDDEPIRIVDSQTNDNAGFLYHYSDGGVDDQNGDEYIQLYLYDGFDFDEDDDYAWINDYVWVTAYQTSSTVGRFDVINGYATSTPEQTTIPNMTFLPGDRYMSVGSPAVSKNVVSVGAYVSDIDWVDISSMAHTTQYPVDFTYVEGRTPRIGEIAYFSSWGPTRDNRLAPIITAPGDLIFANRSYDIDNEDLDEEVMTEGGKLIGYQGTSMASPFTAGTIALMLQVNPNLEYADIVNIFEKTAVKDNETGSEASTTWGHGKLNAYESVLEAYALSTSIDSNLELLKDFKLLEAFPNPFNPTTTIRFNLNQTATVEVSITNILGQNVKTLIANKIMTSGVHSVQLNAETLSSGIYFVRLVRTGVNGNTNIFTKAITLISRPLKSQFWIKSNV
jgi:subtilisin family serine protease